MDKQTQTNLKKVFTIPNLLSMVRLLLIPVFVWLYLKRETYGWAAVVLILSGVTDIVDGYIARHFHAVSDLGKVLDPIADKLTQFAVLLCLVHRFPIMLLPLVILVIKELVTGIFGLVVVCATKQVDSADWHGKVCTALLYATMALHLVWPEITKGVSQGTILACAAMMILSFVLYCIRNFQALARQSKQSHE